MDTKADRVKMDTTQQQSYAFFYGHSEIYIPKADEPDKGMIWASPWDVDSLKKLGCVVVEDEGQQAVVSPVSTEQPPVPAVAALPEAEPVPDVPSPVDSSEPTPAVAEEAPTDGTDQH